MELIITSLVELFTQNSTSLSDDLAFIDPAFGYLYVSTELAKFVSGVAEI